MDVMSQLALQRASSAASDIEAQMQMGPGMRPVLLMIHMAKTEAAAAMSALCDVDPENPKEIRRLQNLVHRYVDLCRYAKDVIEAGDEADKLMSAADQQELVESLSQTPEGLRELTELGLITGDNYASH